MALDLETILGDYLPVLGRDHFPVRDIPPKSREQRVDQRLPNVRFLDSRGYERAAIG